MPLKLPAPVLGTEEQAAPKSAIDEVPEPDGMAEPDAGAIDGDADDFAELPEAAELPELPELQAAAPRASPVAATETARVR
ncbi:MAG: hypothetical protein FWE35_21620 [Streptosporangiales bacterium]|jgi:hypothetical protein|nr:hypothetical protein [Streptosporangiales bacterium]